MKVEPVEVGPLFVADRLTYTFDNGGKYVATVTAIADYSFIDLHERITGIRDNDQVRWRIDWVGFHATHREKVAQGVDGIRGEDNRRQRQDMPSGAWPIDRPRVAIFHGEQPHWGGETNLEDCEDEFFDRLNPHVRQVPGQRGDGAIRPQDQPRPGEMARAAERGEWLLPPPHPGRPARLPTQRPCLRLS